MTTKQRIGLLTSGGDCSGLNAALRAVVHRAVVSYDWDVIGIENGTLGLLQRAAEARPLTPADFNGTLMRESGMFLGSANTGNPFTFERPDGSTCDRSSEVAEGMRELGLDGLICIPKTIDNDVDVPIDGAISAYYAVDIDGPVVATARGYGISLGDT